MSEVDYQAIVSELNSTKNELNMFLKSLKEQNRLREKIEDNQKQETNRRLDEMNDNIKLLFTKTDDLKDEVGNVVKELKDRPCDSHKTELLNQKKDIGRLYSWIIGIVGAVLSLGASIIFKK